MSLPAPSLSCRTSIRKIPPLPSETVSLPHRHMVSGLGKEFSYYHSLNAKHYAATHPEILKPIGSTAFCAMRYLTGTSAAVAYRSTSYRTFTMGFPLECISDEKTRYSIMQGILKFPDGIRMIAGNKSINNNPSFEQTLLP